MTMGTNNTGFDKRIIRKIRIIGAVGAVSLCISFTLSVFFGRAAFGPNYPLAFIVFRSMLMAFFTSTGFMFFELIVFQEILKQFKFSLVILIKSVIYTLLVIGIFLLISFAFNAVLPVPIQMKILTLTIAVAFAIFLFVTFIMTINRLLGRRILLNFFTGRYYNPVEEERIFMFLDLVSSTSIAEKIGHVEFHKFLNEFFFDITDPIIESNGEIYKYVGDELIAVWKLNDNKKNYGCVNCYFEMRKIIEGQKEKYMKRFGFTPEFRVGMHCGTVITGEMGNYRREVAFLGDVVNTAARIQEESKARKLGLLVSQKLLDRISLPENVMKENVGVVKLKGKENEVMLFTIIDSMD